MSTDDLHATCVQCTTHRLYIYVWDMFHILVKECVGFVIIKATLVFY